MDNRTNILEQSLKLFYEKGYDAIGVQEIADAAGVTKPTLYHYFGSKYGLLQAVAEYGYQPLRAGLEEIAGYEGELPWILERLTKFYFDFCSKHEAYYKLMMAMMYSAESSDTYQVIHPIMQEVLGTLTEMFLKAGNVIGNMRGRQEQYSLGYFGFINNYMLYWFNRKPKERPELSAGQAHEVVHQFLYGIYV